ncbi:hypothetical protein LEN26_011787 [Aphanomyces euteiches]|nr:hypothetical protein Ae201684P_017561 [Aphanomyces euteiches]KAH9105651.1 hypothetical protein AeMF1_018597 [Aphanomyces euteiches]KAH9119124.1 hypothetical protein LEN26_011787 [Aphanomyces euteiches]KAH9187517.1 hypothetical protein AeNC1_010505 [Aphanomyces euteiches]
MPSITAIASVLVSAVGTFLTSPGQGVLVYLNMVSISPWFDFSKPAEPQLGFNGLPRTTNLYLSSTDSVTIGVWHTRASQRADKVVLYLHGNGENRAIHVGVLKHTLYSNSPFHADVVSPDYRGFGDSSFVQPTEQGLYDDAMTAYKYIVSTLGFQPHQVLVHGYSLGSAVATRLVHTLCTLHRSCPAALLLEVRQPFDLSNSLTHV